MASIAGGAAYPPELSDDEQENLANVVKDWTIGNGLAVRPPPTVISSAENPLGIAAVPAPVTLFPSPFPRVCFEQAKYVQQTYNELYAAVSRNEKFLAQIVEE
jgi:glutathione synthase